MQDAAQPHAYIVNHRRLMIETACQVARPLARIRPIFSARGGFYFQASNRSGTVPVAGYHYNSDWTPLLAGLSPAGMAASLAAPDAGVRC
jgi:hypothetical protein